MKQSGDKAQAAEAKPLRASRRRKVIASILVVGGLAFVLQIFLGYSLPGQFRFVRKWGPVVRSATTSGEPLHNNLRGTADKIIFITFDALRYDHVSAYGYPRETTPNLDALASNGYLFTEAISPSTWTNPALASVLTGTYPNVNGVREMRSRLAEDVAIPVQSMSLAGIATVSVTSHPVAVVMTEGFDETIHTIGASATVLTDQAIEWLARHAQDRAFVWIHYFEPHDPYLNPLGIGTLPRKPPSLKVPWPKDCPVPAVIDGGSPAIPERWLFEGGDLLTRNYLLQYDRYIRYADREAGRLVDWIDRQPWSAATVIAVSSDHGEAFGEQGRYQHSGFPIEELIRVPLIVRPGRKREPMRVIDTPVSTIDLLPTFCDLLDVRCPAGMQGRSLTDLLADRPYRARMQFSEADAGDDRRSVVVRAGQYKVTYNQYDEKRFHWIDLEKCPCEEESGDLDELPLIHAIPVLYLYRNLKEYLALEVPLEERNLDPLVEERLRALGYEIE